ncbi:HEAT repeat-containing protein 3-like [Xenia sp. Carnegie-2017]|uniref:HEAT repeat-containing protein 3-like n=1 Tax=Xenia sp. Carnegie-2017 TaxID=2897299 RepID=UPI001F04CBC2|nr:HEAT repeat-containing protein 3-like [Xenia sp. Carnegie-2017]
MGKVKQNKKKNRHKPTGMMSVQEAEAKEDEQVRSMEMKTLPILEKLNSPQERAHACVGLANLVLESKSVQPLMENEIVRRVAPLILDGDTEIQESAAGVLRNLTLSNVPNICKQMIEQDVMTPVCHYVKQLSEQIQASSKISRKIVKRQSSVHEQIMHLLLNLSENSSEIIKKINDESLIPVLINFLNAELFEFENVLITGQCLYTLTENNPTAAAMIVESNSCLKIIEKNLLCSDAKEELLLFKVNMAGILFNIASSMPTHTLFEMFQAIGSIFAKVLSYDVTPYTQLLLMKKNDSHKYEMMDTISSDEKLEVTVQTENPSSNDDTKDGIKDGIKIQDLHYVLEAQQVALEILTNMCCCGDDPDEEEQWETLDNDEHDYNGEDGYINGSFDNEMNQNISPSCLSGEIVSSILSNELPKLVLERCTFDHLNEEIIASSNIPEAAACRKIMKRIQTRALVCLNNLLSNIDVNQLGDNEAIVVLWNKIIKITVKNDDSSRFTRTDDEFVEAASGALRSTLEKLVEANAQECVTIEQVELICSISLVVSFEAAKVNLMNVLGNMGKILIQIDTPDAHKTLQSIGIVLRDVLTSNESLLVIAEALDAIFEVFADSSLADDIATNIKLLSTLEKIVPALKSRVKKERSHLGDRLSIINTARTNLVRFLQYKKQISSK